MAERVFARKMQKVGFADVSIGEHQPYGVERAALYPLFTDEIVDMMRKLIAPERQGSVAIGVIATARAPE